MSLTVPHSPDSAQTGPYHDTSTPLLSNPSSDSSCSSGSTESDGSLPTVSTPRGSLTDPSPIQVYTGTGAPNASQPLLAASSGKTKSSRNLQSKKSFSSWRSSFSRSSASLLLRNSQEAPEAPVTPHAPGQFDDPKTPSPSSQALSALADAKSNLSSAGMTPNISSSSAAGSDTSSRSSTRKLMSSLKRLGVSLRPTTFDRGGTLRIVSSGTAIPSVPPALAEAPTPIRVSYTLASASVTGQTSSAAPVSFAAFLPPDRQRYHEQQAEAGAGHQTDEQVRESTLGSDRKGGGDKGGKDDSETDRRGLFSPDPLHSPVVRGIQGALYPISDLDISSPDRGRTRAPSYPTPVLPPTACPSHLPAVEDAGLPPSASKFNAARSPLEAGTIRGLSPLEASIAREVGLSFTQSNSTHSIGSSLTPSSSLKSLSSMHRLSPGRSPSRSPTPSAFRSGTSTPGTATPPAHSRFTASHSAQSLALSIDSISIVRRQSSMRKPGDSPRGSPICGSKHILGRKQPSPIPPSLINTPRALEPPAHPISPVIGACPIEMNPIPVEEISGRPRTKSGRWRSPTGLFELGGLGLGDLSGLWASPSGRRVSRGTEARQKYEHVDTPGEFGLGAEKEERAKREGESPYFS